jgi:hypothetical protein
VAVVADAGVADFVFDPSSLFEVSFFEASPFSPLPDDEDEPLALPFA